MFIGIEFNDTDGNRFFERLNVTHITRLTFVNVRNPDAGTLIHLRTGETLKTSMPMDIISEVVDDAWQQAAALILVTFLKENLEVSVIKESSADQTSSEKP